MAESTGYGPRHAGYSRLCFDGNGEKFELRETKFLGHLRLHKLQGVVTKTGDLNDAERAKNADAYADLIQVLDDVSLSIIMRKAKDDGMAALKLLRQHYCGTGKPRILSLCSTLTILRLGESETTTDYFLRAEKAWTALKDAGETVGDGLIVAMLLNGRTHSSLLRCT